MSDWYTDSRQNRKIEELQDELAYARDSATQTAKRLRSDLARATGSIESRLNRLASAFDAFVEIGDLRVTLGLFDDHMRVRYQARRFFGDTPTPTPLSDVDGYWLAPALAAKQNPADSSVADLLELANVRDARRAVTFHVLASAVLDRGEQVTIGEIAETLPELGSTFPLQVRAIWTLAVDGSFGAAGRQLAQRRATEFVAGRSAEEREAGVAGWMTLADPADLPAPANGLSEAKAHRGALVAGDRLAALRVWVADALAIPAEPPAPDLDPAVRRGLELLVDEGSEAEIPLLARERELRAMIENGDAAGTPDTWESSAGDTAELLKQDIHDGTRPWRRMVVVRAHGRQIIEAAERLAETATAQVADEVEVRTRRGTVTITKRGPVGTSLDQAEHRLAPSFEESATAKRYGGIAAAVGVALLVLALFAGWGWVIPAVVVIGVAGLQFRRAARAEAEARVAAEQARQELRAEANRRVELLAEVAAEVTRRRDRAADDLAAIRSALG